MADTLLSLTGITKSFGPVQVLGGIDLAIPRGQVLGLLGENGAGKSTLMNIVSGRHMPDSGSMTLEGEGFSPRSVAEGIDKGIRFVHQELSLAGALTVAENLFLGSYLAGPLGFIDRRGMRQRARGLLASVGLADLDPDTAVGRLRAGEQQLIEIAKALVTRPKLLILDEPTQGLSDAEIEGFIRLVRDVAKEETVLLIEHNMPLVMELAHRITVLDRGSILAEGSPAEIRANQSVQDAYLGSG